MFEEMQILVFCTTEGYRKDFIMPEYGFCLFVAHHFFNKYLLFFAQNQ